MRSSRKRTLTSTGNDGKTAKDWHIIAGSCLFISQRGGWRESERRREREREIYIYIIHIERYTIYKYLQLSDLFGGWFNHRTFISIEGSLQREKYNIL